MVKAAFSIFLVVSIFLLFRSSAGAAVFEIDRNFQLSRTSVKVEHLKNTPQSQGGIGLDLQGFFGDVPFTVRGTSGSSAEVLDPERNWPVSLTLEAAGLTLLIEGSVKDTTGFQGIDLDFQLKGKSASGFEKLFGAAIPIKGPFDLKGRLKDSAPKVYQFDELYLTWEKSSIKGSCKIDTSGDRPYVKADFFSSRLDLRGFSNAEKDSVASKPAKEGAVSSERVFSTKPYDLDFLKALNLDLELIAEKILLPRTAFTDFHLAAAVDNGVLTIEPVKGGVGGGLLDGRVRLAEAEENLRLSVFLSVEQMDLKRLLDEMELKVAGEGGVDFEIDIESRGRSLAEIMAGLDGSASLVMGKGEIDREYLKYLGFFRINLISVVANIINLPGKFGSKKSASDVNCFAMRFDVKDGLADLSALALDTPNTLVVGNGKINLANEKIDIYIKPISKEGIGAKGIAEINLSLAELTRPFSLGGTLNNPHVSVDTTRTFLTLGKAIGGVVLFGPAGVAAALISGEIGSRPENPCLEAIEAAEKGVEIDENKSGVFKNIKNFLKELSPIR